MTFLEQLKCIVATHRNPSRNLLHSNKDSTRALVAWVYNSTRFLDEEAITFSTRIFYLVNGLTSLPTCRTCGKTLHGKNFSVTSTELQYRNSFCGSRCTQLDASIRGKITATMVERYGVDSPFKAESTKKKMRESNLLRYGVEYPLQSKAIRTRCLETMMKKYGCTNVGAVPEVIEKRKKTCRENYGVENPFGAKEIKQKIKSTLISKYGVDSVMKIEGIRSRIEATMMKRHGVKSYLKTEKCRVALSDYMASHGEAVREKIADTFEKKYGNRAGVIFHSEKFNETMMKRYGTTNPMQNHELRMLAKKKYFYDGMAFDSSDEIAYYIWNVDHGLVFTYQPEITFEYEHNGETHFYMPDFRMSDGELVEIKGAQFFKADGTMQNPYDHTQDDLYEAKHQCMKKHGVRIIITSSKEFGEVRKYIRHTYGRRFLSKFKKT